MDIDNLSEIVASLTEDQQNEVIEFVMSMSERSAQRPRTRLRQDWAGGMADDRQERSALELQRSIFA